MTGPREVLLQCFRSGLARVDGREAVRRYLSAADDPGKVHLVSVGKAASMAAGALEVLGGAVQDGIVISKTGHIDDDLREVQRLQCMESDHPVPTRRSLDAGEALVAYVRERAGRDAKFLFLLSGGASSLVEVLPDGMGLDDLIRLNSALLAGGLDIGRMNVARRAASCIKGGRLAGHLGESRALNLLISDVPGDDPAVIGSGLLAASHDPVDWNEYPDEVRRILRRVDIRSVPGAEVFERVQTHIIASLEEARRAAADEARRLGYPVTVQSESVFRGVDQVGMELADHLMAADPGIHIWGGETSVVLPPNPGSGGRNQHLALTAAVRFRRQKDVCFLAAGTDGTDGVTDDAGGIVDGGTVERGKRQGLDAEDFLRRADSNTFLAATGDLVHTGPTGTNVMDLMIGWRSGGSGSARVRPGPAIVSRRSQ